MSLTKLLKGGRRNVGKYAAGFVAAAAASLYSGNAASAANRNIYPTNHATTPWTFQDVQDYLNPSACSNRGGSINGEDCPIAGDNIIFNGHVDGSEGVYTPPIINTPQSYELRTNNINLTGNNARFRGDPASSLQILFKTYSEGNTISGFNFEAANGMPQSGVLAENGFKPENPVTVTGNSFYKFDVATAFKNVSTQGANSSAGFKIDGNYFEDVFLGSMYSGGNDPTDETTVYGTVKNSTFRRLMGAGQEPPLYEPPGATASATRIVPGLDEFDNNVFIDSDGVPMTQDAYNGEPPGGFVASGMFNPEKNMEFDIANNTAPGYPLVGYLPERWPNSENVAGEVLGDAKINWANRPKPGSPAISRKAGAFTPVFDTGNRDGDWTVTYAEDFHGTNGFRQAFYASMVNGNPTQKQLSLNDVNGDGNVNWYDFSRNKQNPPQEDTFAQACIDCDEEDLETILNADLNGQNIPATSTWGLITMGLATAAAGTILLRKRDYELRPKKLVK